MHMAVSWELHYVIKNVLDDLGMPQDDLLVNRIDDHKNPLTEQAVESDFSILVVQYAVYQRLQQISII
jgi:hypothetical protein